MHKPTPSLGPLLARGRTAEVFAWDEDRVIKLFYDWCPTRLVDHEMEIARLISSMRLPSPKVITSQDVDGRRGIVYERVNGPSMLKLLITKPWLVFRVARQLAELQTAMHALRVDALPSQRTALVETIRRLDDFLPDLKSRVLRLLEALPDGDALCHMDFHPDQVLLTASGPVIIDWITAQQGHPLGDAARTWLLLKFGQLPYGNWALRMMIGLVRGFLHRTYLARYLQLHPGVSRQDVMKWAVPLAAARLQENIPGEHEQILKFILYHLAEFQGV